jgi:hypothetical protein
MAFLLRINDNFFEKLDFCDGWDRPGVKNEQDEVS